MAPKRKAGHAASAGASKEATAHTSTTKSPKAKKPKPLVSTTSVEVTAELKNKGLLIAKQLQGLFPNPPIPLQHETPFQLLVAVMLSAQVWTRTLAAWSPWCSPARHACMLTEACRL